jgi:hypothetical protein
MLFHLLSLLDMLSGVILLGGHFELFKIPVLYAALYLGGKILFWRDFFSFVDLAAAAYFVFVFFGHESALTWVFFIYFLYKFSVWLFSSMGR